MNESFSILLEKIQKQHARMSRQNELSLIDLEVQLEYLRVLYKMYCQLEDKEIAIQTQAEKVNIPLVSLFDKQAQKTDNQTITEQKVVSETFLPQEEKTVVEQESHLDTVQSENVVNENNVEMEEPFFTAEEKEDFSTENPFYQTDMPPVDEPQELVPDLPFEEDEIDFSEFEEQEPDTELNNLFQQTEASLTETEAEADNEDTEEEYQADEMSDDDYEEEDEEEYDDEDEEEIEEDEETEEEDEEYDDQEDEETSDYEEKETDENEEELEETEDESDYPEITPDIASFSATHSQKNVEQNDNEPTIHQRPVQPDFQPNIDPQNEVSNNINIEQNPQTTVNQPVSDTTVADKYQSTKPSLNEIVSSFKPEDSIGMKLHLGETSDLMKSMDYNNKFLFVKELFHNNGTLFTQEINKLNELTKLSEVISYLQSLQVRYGWNTASDAYKELYQLILRKFAKQ
ncbi:MAG: hypothetical protein LBR36_01510 [Bacteroidales bacterium]|jgi:hypothetical protein|nr:hypothetical protein [Bacteroidales bacterium]